MATPKGFTKITSRFYKKSLSGMGTLAVNGSEGGLWTWRLWSADMKGIITCGTSAHRRAEDAISDAATCIPIWAHRLALEAKELDQ